MARSGWWGRIVRLWRRLPAWAEFSIVAVAAVVFLVLGGSILWATVVPIPAINQFENRKVAESTKIFDRTGNVVLYDVHGNMRRTAVPLEDISPFIQKATIAIEDTTFYEHKGFRPAAFLRAVLVQLGLREGYAGQGGSTITQQVVKNALLTQDKTIVRKLKEIILALRLERVYSKDQILATYLNENPYGGTIYGVEEASQYYFGVPAKDVDLAQAAYLAALPQAPTYYSPYGNHLDALHARKTLVLSRMLEAGFITEAEHDAAVNENVEFKPETDAGIKAPHFVFFIREYLEQKYGVDAVQSEGLHVVTTIDYDLQKKAEQVLADDVPQMERNFNASNAGVVAVDPSTGQILAMVGSRGYFDQAIDGQVNVTTSERQPGSSFKPFVYATAFEMGYTPDTVVFDLPTQFSTACSPSDNLNSAPPCYSPSNYDGTFKGPLKLRDALAISENVPAVKVLYLTGIENSISTAERLGITTLEDAGRYGLTLVLGGGEVTLLEMTSAYSVFANDGVRNPATGILRVEDARGKILESYEDTSVRVLEPQVARMINDVLSDNEARTPEFGANSPLFFTEANVADKTGTTNDFHDVWVIGYTPGIAVGAWAGNNDNSAMERRIAAFIIAPMWHKIMSYAIQKYPADDFNPPAPDPDYENLPPVLRGEWNSNPSEGIHDILYWVNKTNPRSGRPSNPTSDSQFYAWEYPVQIWAQQQIASSSPIGGFGTGTTIGGFTITSPAQGSVVSAQSALVLTVHHPDPASVTRVTYYIDGNYVGASAAAPYIVSIVPNPRGQVQLSAIADTVNGPQQTGITFTIQ